MMIQMAESGWLPDGLVRFGIRRLLARRLLQEQQQQQTNTCVLTTAPVAWIRMPPMSSTTRWMPGFTSRCWGLTSSIPVAIGLRMTLILRKLKRRCWR